MGPTKVVRSRADGLLVGTYVFCDKSLYNLYLCCVYVYNGSQYACIPLCMCTAVTSRWRHGQLGRCERHEANVSSSQWVTSWPRGRSVRCRPPRTALSPFRRLDRPVSFLWCFHIYLPVLQSLPSVQLRLASVCLPGGLSDCAKNTIREFQTLTPSYTRLYDTQI